MSLKVYHREVNYIVKERHPLLYDISRESEWISEDEFPAAPEWADEHEKWLRFVFTKGEWDRFRPRLVKSAWQRDRAFSEISIAHFLETICGLPVVTWEPEGANGTKGEYLVRMESGHIFVEVKTGSWQKDIKDSEGKDSPRLKQPKYINGEARSVSNSQVIKIAIEDKHKKFTNSSPNLLIIRDDYQIPLERLLGPDIALYRSGDGSFADHRYERLGAVAIFRVDLLNNQIHHHFSVYDNPHALTAVRLPPGLFQGHPRRSS